MRQYTRIFKNPDTGEIEHLATSDEPIPGSVQVEVSNASLAAEDIVIGDPDDGQPFRQASELRPALELTLAKTVRFRDSVDPAKLQPVYQAAEAYAIKAARLQVIAPPSKTKPISIKEESK